MAYQITGDSFFKDVAESHLDSYKVRLDQRLGLLGHDVGFPYMPSCAAAYKVAGNEYGRDIALETAKFFIDNSYDAWQIQVYKTRLKARTAIQNNDGYPYERHPSSVGRQGA